MSQSVVIEPIPVPTDGRGWVLEPLGAQEFAEQRNAHVVWTYPGFVRGNHYHEHGDEITVAVGPALFRYHIDGLTSDFVMPDAQAYRFRIPRGVPHAFRNTGDRPMILVGFNTQAHDPSRPDVVAFRLFET